MLEDTENGDTLRVRGFIDRVDYAPDGRARIIDYKTGGRATPNDWMGERPDEPQLPLYAEALGMYRVSAVAFGRVRTGDTGYCGLARDSAVFPGLKSPSGRAWPREYPSWQDLLQAWRRRLATLAAELGPRGVRVNAVAPGVVDTPLTAPIKAQEGWYAAYADKAILGRWGRPEDFAAIAVFLAGPGSDYVTGACITVDGGYSIGI